MWGFGGRYYWGRKERAGKVEGIVVVFAWMSSHERHLKSYSDLYSSLGWNSLICHSQFLNMFFPEKATSLATDILNELVQELKIKRVPVVFASFSGGPKACMAKVLQIIEGVSEEPEMSDYQLVKDCICGHIYDSSPVDFTSDLGTRFVLHPTVMKMPQPPRVVSWLVNGIASSLDALFLSRFEQQRADYWQTLYSTVSLKAPYLLLCSENDDLAPYRTIVNFAQRLQELGADVKMVKWDGSPHVGHYRHHKVEYEAAITELLSKASEIYGRRTRGLGGEGTSFTDAASRDGIIESTKAAQRNQVASSNGFQGMSLATGSDDLFLPSSTAQYYEGKEVQREDVIRRISYPPRINAHGVLGQVLFDICVPKDVEDWDVVHSSANRRGPGRRHTHFNPIKCIRRSRL